MAYPILYKANETNFEHLGVSVLSDASKCYVSREKNGIYILEFDYPVNGKDVDKIKEGMLIKSDAGYRTKNQRFIVSKITKTQNEFKIYCQHISQVKTTMNAIRPDISITGSALMALSTWRDNLLDSRDEFFVNSDISTVNSTTWKVENIENARDALGGKAGSILDVWGGEYEFDNLNITLHKSMGIDNPTIIAYGKNLLDLEQEQSILETYTSVFPFKKYTDDNNREQLITLPEILLDSTHLNKFTHRRILKVDFSSDENLKTVEQLRSKTKSYIKSNNVGVPKTNLKINYQDLSKVEGVFDNPALEQIDLCDRLKVYYSELGILNENAKVVKVVWDVILEENHEIEVGDGRSSFTDSTSAKLEALQAQNDSVLARINALISEQEEAFDRYFNEKSKVIEDAVKAGAEKSLLSSEEKIRKMGEAFDEKVNQFRNQVSATVENYNRQFQATNLEISKNRVEATKQIQALTDRVNNIQDISNNETVRELRGLVNGATSKVTELETSMTREFTAVKKKNEDSLSAVKTEFTKGVDGLTSKISSLEDYKNQDGTRTESLKQWVQRDTASQLSRERTEINKIIDSKDFVKNSEFSSKFTGSARGIINQLSALETYKNQDGVRVANLKIWAQNNTANQLTAERRSIESWVNEKGYATTSVVENKVRETANSFSRDLSNATNSINLLNSWKQTATETLNTVSSGLNDAVKHSQLRVGADKIDFGSNKVFDGRNLASMLSVSPESIKAITNKLIITPSNENLVKSEYRRNSSFTKDMQISEDFDIGKTTDFLVKGKARTNNYENRFRFALRIIYKDGTNDFVTGVESVRYINGGEFSIPFKINEREKEIKNAYFTIDRYGKPIFDELSIVPQKSAELIVDGTIEGKHIKSSTIETGHHKAGSITSDIIAANAVKAKHVVIDDGLIHNLITHNAFINKLWAQQAFINKLSAVKIKSTQIDTDTLNGVVISGQSKIKIGQYGFLQPIEKGLQINAPENFGSKRGIGLQISGEGVGPKDAGVPPGLFIYEDSDFTRGNTVPSAVNRVLLTVAGMACFSSRVSGSVVKGQPILTNLDSGFPFSATYPVKFIGYQEGGFMRFFGTDNDNTNIWNIKVDTWGSDRKLKTDIKDSEFNAVEFVEKLKFKDHGWNKDEIGYERPHTKCGLIAQELQELDESLVVDYGKYLGLDGLRLINIALKAVQELSKQNKELKNKLEELKYG